jgi:AraC-like DNA-binding protein
LWKAYEHYIFIPYLNHYPLNTYIHNYLFSDPEKSFPRLASVFDGELEEDSIIIPEKKGSGRINKFQADYGLCFTTWNIYLKHAMAVERLTQDSGEKLFSLFYIFTNESFALSNRDNFSGRDEVLKNIIMVSGDSKFRYSICPNASVRVLEIYVLKNWLLNVYASNNLSAYSYFTILMNKTPSLLTEKASLNSHHSLLGIYEHLNSAHPDPAYVSTKTMMLLSDIFNGIGKRDDAAYKNDLVMGEKIIELEKIMDDHLDKNLPSINAIAKQLALSESTLKRNFKLMCGSNIYEYYLKKKMERAREMLDENPMTVKEVAYRLGYDKVSNFITIFKKYYEFSPGYLKKNTVKKFL